MRAIKVMLLLLCSWLLPGTLTIYVDEPLLYDTFPSGFVWASATSAHQIEGAWNVDGMAFGPEFHFGFLLT